MMADHPSVIAAALGKDDLCGTRQGAIHERMRDALQRGVVLDNPNLGKMVTEATAGRDEILRPVLQTMRDRTYREIAQELTDRGIQTPGW